MLLWGMTMLKIVLVGAGAAAHRRHSDWRLYSLAALSTREMTTGKQNLTIRYYGFGKRIGKRERRFMVEHTQKMFITFMVV